jgi:predicted nucleic acid-binding protein
MSLVLDNSVTMAWFMPNEHDASTQSVLDHVVVSGAVVPSLWSIEIGHTLLLAVRHGRISLAQRTEALGYLSGLGIETDSETQRQAWGTTLDLGERFKLTLYDACYLELAQRLALPLATRDRDLRSAGRALGLELLGV